MPNEGKINRFYTLVKVAGFLDEVAVSALEFMYSISMPTLLSFTCVQNDKRGQCFLRKCFTAE